jgi:hypothetical protein
VGRFQFIWRAKVAFVLVRLGKKTTADSFLSSARTVRSNPRVPPSGSNPTRRLPRREVGNTRREEEARGGTGGAGGDKAAARG